MSSVTELRKEQLKSELAALEAAEQQKKTITAELAEAEQAVTEASRLVQLNKLRLTEETASLEQLSNESAKIPQGLSAVRSQNDVKTQRVRQTINQLTIECEKLEGELRKKEHAHAMPHGAIWRNDPLRLPGFCA